MNDVPRSLPIVIDLMVEHIPPHSQSFRSNLLILKNKALYTAPERMRPIWGLVAGELEVHFPVDPNALEPWQREMVDIFMDTPSIPKK